MENKEVGDNSHFVLGNELLDRPGSLSGLIVMNYWTDRAV